MEEVITYLNSIRREYAKQELDVKSVNQSPYKQLAVWLEDAVNAQVIDPNAMILSTVDKENKPTSRVVLLRGMSENGIIFYTNYDSQKSKEIQNNNYVAINFFWLELERQIRIEGVVSKVDDKISDEYFAQRPRESQIGAWASLQSEEMGSRKELEDKIKEIEEKFKGKEVSRPPFWGGYEIDCNYFEFWQGRPSRLHDRIIYKKEETNSWKISRLYP